MLIRPYKIFLDNHERCCQGGIVHTVGVVPDLRMPDMGKERGFLVFGRLSELPGYREVLDVPMGVNITRAFLLPEVQTIGGFTMSKNYAVVPFVQIVNNQVITTTVDVSRKFGKHHKDVLRAIRNPEIPNDFHKRNFAPVNIIEENAIGGKIGHGYYNLTRDGFTILAMGFTGAKAMKFKIAYIEAFNKMETQLMQKRFPELPAPGLTPDQQRKVQRFIGEKVYATENKKLYPTYFRQLYRAIKDEFKVGKYNQVPATQFDELTAYIHKIDMGEQTRDGNAITRKEFEAVLKEQERVRQLTIDYVEAHWHVRDDIANIVHRMIDLNDELSGIAMIYDRAHGYSSTEERIRDARSKSVSMAKDLLKVGEGFVIKHVTVNRALRGLPFTAPDKIIAAV